MFTITKQLQINNTTVNAVEINDNGDVYPVFLESLLNQVMFDTLLVEGYKYVKMPYGFFRDDKMLEELPVESRTLTDDQLESMYNAIGRKLDDSYLKEHITTEAVRTVATPATHYTIFTREDFLDYLKLVSEQALTDDVMPINYFVSPEARFSIQEYRGKGFLKWVDIITKRRTMTLARFRNMIKKFQSMGLMPANYTPMDVVAAYMSWGLDGLNCDITEVHREFRLEILEPSTSVKHLKIRTIPGLIDANGNQILPPDERSNPWTPVTKERSEIEKITSRLRGDDTAVINFETQVREEVIVMTIPKLTIQVSLHNIKLANGMYSMFKVIDPTNVKPYVPIELCLPNASEKLYDHLMIEALAKDFHRSRRLNIDVSSYKALSLSGLDPRAALEYIFHNGDFTQIDFDEETAIGGKVSASGEALLKNEVHAIDSIAEYVDGTLDKDKPIYNMIDSIIEGFENIDATARGSMLDNECQVSGVINELTAVHTILGVSFDDMYSIINRERQTDETTITFRGNGLSHTMLATPLRHKLGGYSEDLHAYDSNSARDSTWMSYVIRVAREVGIPEARRHVGMEFYYVDRRQKGAKNILNRLASSFESRVNMTITDSAQRNGLLSWTWPFACSRFFEIALKETITWPVQLGGLIENAEKEDIIAARRCLQRKVESLTAYCEFTVNDGGHYYKLNGFCVNAQITTSMVIPRSGCEIREAPLWSLWFDYSHNPQDRPLYKQLIEHGVFEKEFIAWESRYSEEMFKKRTYENMSKDPTSLSYIYHKSLDERDNYPANREFVTVHHPVEYTYPGLYTAEEDFSDMAVLPVPRSGKPVVRLGAIRTITFDDYRDVLRPQENRFTDDSYIRELAGISSDILFTVSDAVDKIPYLNTNSILVHKSSKTIALIDVNITIDFHRIAELDLNKYNIVKIIGNVYWFNDLFGKVWEVRI